MVTDARLPGPAAPHPSPPSAPPVPVPPFGHASPSASPSVLDGSVLDGSVLDGSGPRAWQPVQPVRPAGVPGLRGSRADLRSALLTVAALTVAGLATGGLWTWLAPRADYRVTADGIEPIGKPPSSELFMADDGVFVLVLAGLGLLAGLAVWLNRRRRGALTLTALATGMLAAGVVTWQLGERVGARPTEAELADVGATVTTGLSLGATAALAVGPFTAVLTYLVATALTSRDDLGRAEPEPPGAAVRPPLPPVPPPTPRGQ